MDYLTSAHLHPSGEAVALTARGRVFVAPVGDGRLVRASHEPGVRYRDVGFMPDGRLLGLTDATGELEFTLLSANGVGPPGPLTSDGMPLRFRGHPSPDGRRIGLTRDAAAGGYRIEGEWLIEGHGFEPDIVVDNLPHATFNGADAQLDAAIEYLLDAIARDPREVPPPPPFPNKAFAYPVPTADQGGR